MAAQKCPHDTFEALCKINKIFEGDPPVVTSYACEVKVRCKQCGLEFGFLGPPAGLSQNGPTTSADGLELRIPIRPGAVLRNGPLRAQHRRYFDA